MTRNVKRSAECVSVVIPFVRSLGSLRAPVAGQTSAIVEEVVGIEFVVANILIRVAVESPRAALGGELNVGARVFAHLGPVIGGGDAEFRDGVNARISI